MFILSQQRMDDQANSDSISWVILVSKEFKTGDEMLEVGYPHMEHIYPTQHKPRFWWSDNADATVVEDGHSTLYACTLKSECFVGVLSKSSGISEGLCRAPLLLSTFLVSWNSYNAKDGLRSRRMVLTISQLIVPYYRQHFFLYGFQATQWTSILYYCVLNCS